MLKKQGVFAENSPSEVVQPGQASTARVVGNGVESIRMRTYQCLALIIDTTVQLKINLKLYQAE